MYKNEPQYIAYKAAICAQPLDLTLRNRFADWLIDNGEYEFGQFILGQLQGIDCQGDNWEMFPDIACEFTTKNGLPTSLICTFDQFLKGSHVGCGYCISRGIATVMNAQRPCSLCGRGSYTAVAIPSLSQTIQRYPIIEIVITDKQPRKQGRFYRWTRDNSVTDTLNLPKTVLPQSIYDRVYKSYTLDESHDKAMTRLSQVLVNLGREKAKLPTL